MENLDIFPTKVEPGHAKAHEEEEHSVSKAVQALGGRGGARG